MPAMRRLLALLLVFLPVQGSAATLLSGRATGHAHCSGDVCRCASHCPPKKPAAARSCHEAEAPLGALLHGARCGGDADGSAAPVSSRPQVTPEPFDVGPAFRSAALVVGAETDARAGFLQIDLPPPRTA